MNYSDAKQRALTLARDNNNVYMILKHYNRYVSWNVYYVYAYDGRDNYVALAYPDGYILEA